MSLDLFIHISCGRNGGAAPLLARVALCLGGHWHRYPVTLAETARVAQTADHRANMLNALFVADLIRSCLRGESPRWSPDQAGRLAVIANCSPVAEVVQIGAANGLSRRD